MQKNTKEYDKFVTVPRVWFVYSDVGFGRGLIEGLIASAVDKQYLAAHPCRCLRGEE